MHTVHSVSELYAQYTHYSRVKNLSNCKNQYIAASSFAVIGCEPIEKLPDVRPDFIGGAVVDEDSAQVVRAVLRPDHEQVCSTQGARLPSRPACQETEEEERSRGALPLRQPAPRPATA